MVFFSLLRALTLQEAAKIKYGLIILPCPDEIVFIPPGSTHLVEIVKQQVSIYLLFYDGNDPCLTRAIPSYYWSGRYQPFFGKDQFQGI